MKICAYVHFNPRPPARGATAGAKKKIRDWYSISIHAPREGGDYDDSRQGRKGEISIHAPREGGDSPPMPL